TRPRRSAVWSGRGPAVGSWRSSFTGFDRAGAGGAAESGRRPRGERNQDEPKLTIGRLSKYGVVMNIIRAVLFPGLLGSCAIAGSHANLSAPQGFIDEQIGAQYPRGTVFVVRQKGLFGVNPECTTFAMATYKEDGRLHSPGLAQRAAAVGAGCLL